MNARRELAALRRQRLVAECALQRADMAQQLQPLAHTLESVNTGVRILGRLRSHPGWIAAGVAGLMLVTPRRLSALLRTGSLGLRTWRSLAPGLQLLLSRRG
jgi:hypothetical protein